MDAVSGADQVISSVGSIALSAAEDALIVQVPWLGLPVIKQIWEYLVGKLAAQVILELEKGSNILIIDISDGLEAQAAKQAADKLKAVQSDPKATADEVAQASQNFQDAYASLIQFRQSTPMSSP